ncbi:DNA repair protein RadC [Omnitrophica bacterium]|nr:DNA repair protein RadC [Candidatus Omnitrophota bacterium]
MGAKYLKRLVASYVRDKDVPYSENLKSPEEVVRSFEYLRTRDREEFVSLHLDKGNRPLCWDRVSVGTLSEALVHPREVFKTALLSNASAVIFIHNHPSGRGEPSPEDRQITKKLLDAARLLEIQVMDHLIIYGEDGRFFSFREQGLL